MGIRIRKLPYDDKMAALEYINKQGHVSKVMGKISLESLKELVENEHIDYVECVRKSK